jgi:hypothetical protein
MGNPKARRLLACRKQVRTPWCFQIPEDLLTGSQSQVQIPSGKPTCHCADGDGHPAWYFSFMANDSPEQRSEVMEYGP